MSPSNKNEQVGGTWPDGSARAWPDGTPRSYFNGFVFGLQDAPHGYVKGGEVSRSAKLRVYKPATDAFGTPGGTYLTTDKNLTVPPREPGRLVHRLA